MGTVLALVDGDVADLAHDEALALGLILTDHVGQPEHGGEQEDSHEKQTAGPGGAGGEAGQQHGQDDVRAAGCPGQEHGDGAAALENGAQIALGHVQLLEHGNRQRADGGHDGHAVDTGQAQQGAQDVEQNEGDDHLTGGVLDLLRRGEDGQTEGGRRAGLAVEHTEDAAEQEQMGVGRHHVHDLGVHRVLPAGGNVDAGD